MMASQTHKMATWTLAAMLLCAQFEVAESVQENCFQKIKNLLNWRQASNCVTECAKCGQNRNPYDSTIVIVNHFKPQEYVFGTVIGQRLALTTEKGSQLSSVFTSKSNYNVYLVYYTKFLVGNYQFHLKINAIKTVKKSNGDGLMLIVFHDSIPPRIRPACLPTSELKTKEGMQFDVSFYKKLLYYKDGTKLATHYSLPKEVTSRKLKTIDEKNSKGRHVTLDYCMVEKEKTLFATVPGGPALHNVHGRNMLYGMLDWSEMGTRVSHNLRIVTIDDHDVVEWIHKSAGKYCVCEEPKAEVTPTPTNEKHHITKI